jgi:hypothetical protein
MPQPRKPNSGLFSISIKEDGYYLDFSERALLMREGARSSQTLELPLYFIDKGYFTNKKLIESLGLEDEQRKVEVYIQYARLPFLDPHMLEELRREVLERAEAARAELLEKHNPVAMFDLLKLDLCDNPITFIEHDAEKGTFRLKARAPFPPSLPGGTLGTHKKQETVFKDYVDVLCSQAAMYLLKAGEYIPGLESMEVTLVRMEPQPVSGLKLEVDEKPAGSGFRKFGQRVQEVPYETEKERRKRLKKEEKEAKKRGKERINNDQFIYSRREACDELFDGSLPHESVLLSARVPRVDFMSLNRSKNSYTARAALEHFELRLNADEEGCNFEPVEPFFTITI